MSANEVEELIQLPTSRKKHLKYFSSGMKQRAKLAIAIMSDVQISLLDEPLSNLDKAAGTWYRKMVEEYLKSRLVVVCSNHHSEEYDFCEQVVNINDYK